MLDLPSCPFCWGEAYIAATDYHFGTERPIPACKRCGAQAASMESWKRRTPSPALGRLLKWLDENPETYGIRACSYGILKCLDDLRAEWSEKKKGGS